MTCRENRVTLQYVEYLYELKLLFLYCLSAWLEDIADRQEEAVTEVADALGNITRTETDAQGNITAVRHYDGERTLLTQAEYEYDML